jgi:hypothetical protein
MSIWCVFLIRLGVVVGIVGDVIQQTQLTLEKSGLSLQYERFRKEKKS